MTHEELTSKVIQLEELLKAGNDFEQVETFAQTLLDESITPNHTELHCRVVLSLTESLWQRGLARNALPYAEIALTLAERMSDEFYPKALRNIASVYRMLSDYPRALEYYHQSLSLHEELGMKRGMAVVASDLGIVYKNLSDYPRALEYYQQSLSLNTELGIKQSIAASWNNIGNVYSNLSDYPRALECFQQALVVSKELSDRNIQAHCTGNIGLIYFYLADYRRAEEYTKQALSYFQEIGKQQSIAVCLSYLGGIYSGLSEYTQALDCLLKALLINEEIGDRYGQAAVLHNIGLVYWNLSDYSRSLENFQKALAINEEINNRSYIANNIHSIGNIYATKEGSYYDAAIAEEHLLKALAINQELHINEGLYNNHLSLSKLYAQEKREEEALTHYKRYHELYVEVQSEEATKKAQLMEHRRKIEEAERDRQLKIARHEVTMSLLHKTLPPSIAERLMNGENNIADKFESVSILFADIVGFTPLSARTEPKRMVELLNNLFTRFDKLTIENNVERIKTIGDAYMVVSGAPERCEDHAERLARFAIAMLEETEKFAEEVGEDIRMRVGINTGQAIGAVVGETKFSYDLWSDAVNTASRMESHGEPGRIHVSEEFKQELSLSSRMSFKSFHFLERGEMEIKGKGKMQTYFLEGEL